MSQDTRFYPLAIILALVLSACSMGATQTPGDEQAVVPNPTPVVTLQLTVVTDQSAVYNAVGLPIAYEYHVMNTGSSPFPSPVTVTVAEDKVIPNCPEVTAVGNGDNSLDPNETLICTGSYVITQGDLNAGSVTTVATASAGESQSLASTTEVGLVQNRELTLSKTADPEPFSNAGDVLIFAYRITNSGNVRAGPAQFSIAIENGGSLFNCGSPDTRLPPGEIIECSISYSVTQEEMDAGLVSFTAAATDGTTTSNGVTSTVSRSGPAPGSTVQHTVIDGEWLWQIARCYGADPKQVISDNPLSDPKMLKPNTIITVHNVGSTGTIYGEPCIHFYTVQSSDTWTSITNDFNGRNIDVDIRLLQKANLDGLVPGEDIRVPVGPYQYP
jgi:LysM repeat protein